MSKDLKRRIERLERQVGVSEFETKLRAVVRPWGGNQEAYLRAARGHEQKLGPALGEDGTITWEGYLLLQDLLHPSRQARRQAGPADPRLPSPPAGSAPRRFRFIHKGATIE